jgi:hypothetical protein
LLDGCLETISPDVLEQLNEVKDLGVSTKLGFDDLR